MKKVIVIFCLCFGLCAGSGLAHAVPLDVSNAGMEAAGPDEPDTMVLRNLRVGPNFYHGIFRWHPVFNLWYLTGYGMEGSTFKSQDYFPLAVGDTWTYQLSGGGTRTLTVTGSDEICGDSYMRMEDSGGAINWWRNDDTGVWYVRSQNPDGSYLTYCPPINVSAPYVYSGFSKLTPYENAVLRNAAGAQIANFNGYFSYTGNLNETVVAPAGTFANCPRTNLIICNTETSAGTNGVHIDEIWWAEGVGIVKRITGYTEILKGTLLYNAVQVEILESATVGGVSYP